MTSQQAGSPAQSNWIRRIGLVWLLLFLGLWPISRQLPKALDPASAAQSIQDSPWWLLLMVWLTALMWSAGAYLLYFGIGGLRRGVFPHNPARYLLKTRLRSGLEARLTGIAGILVALGLIATPVLYYAATLHESALSARLRQQLLQDKILPPGR
jgi:hypothetical protein